MFTTALILAQGISKFLVTWLARQISIVRTIIPQSSDLTLAFPQNHHNHFSFTCISFMAWRLFFTLCVREREKDRNFLYIFTYFVYKSGSPQHLHLPISLIFEGGRGSYAVFNFFVISYSFHEEIFSKMIKYCSSPMRYRILKSQEYINKYKQIKLHRVSEHSSRFPKKQF